MKIGIARLYIILAAVCWGIIGIFCRTLSDYGCTPMQIVLIRMGVATAAMVSYLLMRDRKKLKIRWRDGGWFAALGMCSLVFFNWCYFRAMGRTSLAVAAVLLYTAPVFVYIMSVFCLGESLNIRKITALLVAFAGIVLVSGGIATEGADLSMSGVLYGLGAGFGYALYSILGTVLLKKYEPETVCCYAFLFAAIGAAVLTGSPFDKAVVEIPLRIWAAALGIGVFCSMIPFLIYTKGLAVVPASQASVFATLEPVVAALTGAVFFREEVDAKKLCGILLILGGILLLGSGKGDNGKKGEA